MGHDPLRAFSAVHVTAGHAGQAKGGSANLPTACGAFHAYPMHWTPRDVVLGLDGFTHFRYVKFDLGARARPFVALQFLLLNLAIGGNLCGLVDDVRIYQRAQ